MPAEIKEANENEGKKEVAGFSNSYDDDIVESHVDLDAHEIIDPMPSSEEDSQIKQGQPVLDEEDGKDGDYLNRLKSVFGDK